MSIRLRNASRAVLTGFAAMLLPLLLTACDDNPMPDPKPIPCSEIFDRVGGVSGIIGEPKCSVMGQYREILTTTLTLPRDDLDIWIRTAPDLYLEDNCEDADRCGTGTTNGGDNYYIYLTNGADEEVTMTLSIYTDESHSSAMSIGEMTTLMRAELRASTSFTV